MLGSIIVKKPYKKNKSQSRKFSVLEKKFNAITYKQQTSEQKTENQIQRILLEKMIQNDFNREKRFHQGIKSMKIRVKFSEKVEINMNLPFSLKISQFIQLIESYSKLHHKNCTSQYDIFSGLYLPNPLDGVQEKQIPQIQQSEDHFSYSKPIQGYEFNNLVISIMRFIIQNSLFNRKSSIQDLRFHDFEYEDYDQQTWFELWSTEQKLERYFKTDKEIQIQNYQSSQFSQGLQDKNQNIVNLNVRYDSLCYEKKLESNVEGKTYFENNPLVLQDQASQPYLKLGNRNSLKREFSKNYWSLDESASKETSVLKQDIYIKEYTENSEDEQISEKNKCVQNQENLQISELNKDDYITFDPNQMLDSGRFRSQSKVCETMIRWFNESEIVDYLLFKDMIFERNSSDSNDSPSSQKIMQFPIRLRGHHMPYQLVVFRSEQINPIVFRQISKFLKKIIIIISNFLNCKLVEFYSLRMDGNFLQRQNVQKTPQNTTIMVTSVPNIQQIPLVSYLEKLLQTSNSKNQKEQNQKCIQEKQTAIKQTLLTTYLFVQKLLQHLIQQKPDRIKNSDILLNSFGSLDFWSIQNQQRHQFIKKAPHPRFSILSLFVYQSKYNNSSRSHICIDTQKLIKRINLFYESLPQERIISKVSEKKSIQQKQLQKLLNNKLKLQFKQIIKKSLFGQSRNYFFSIFQQCEIQKSHQKQKDLFIRTLNQSLLDQNIFLDQLFIKTKDFLNDFKSPQILSPKKEQKILEKTPNKSIKFLVSHHASIYFRAQLFNVKQKMRQLKSLISKNIRFNSIKCIDSYIIPKMLYFSSGQALNVYEKETTLKKKNSSQSTSHNNSLDLNPRIFVSEFNQSEVFNTIISEKETVPKKYERKLKNFKENKIQNFLTKSDRSQKKKKSKSTKRKQKKA